MVMMMMMMMMMSRSSVFVFVERSYELASYLGLCQIGNVFF